MKRIQRLSSSDFRKIRPGRRYGGTHFILTISPLASGGTRFTCVVSKKIAARATVRNLIKRRCRVAYRTADAPSVPCALVFSAKRTAAGATYKDIATDITELIARMR